MPWLRDLRTNPTLSVYRYPEHTFCCVHCLIMHIIGTPFDIPIQYGALSATPPIMPFFLLESHQCRHVYNNVEQLEAVVANFSATEILRVKTTPEQSRHEITVERTLRLPQSKTTFPKDEGFAICEVMLSLLPQKAKLFRFSASSERSWKGGMRKRCCIRTESPHCCDQNRCSCSSLKLGLAERTVRFARRS